MESLVLNGIYYHPFTFIQSATITGESRLRVKINALFSGNIENDKGFLHYLDINRLQTPQRLTTTLSIIR